MPISDEDIVEAGAQTNPVVFDFANGNLRGYVGESLTDTEGYIYNETYTVDNVQLNITAGSAPSRLYQDKNRGTCLVMYKEYSTLTFTAPEGMAIQSIDFAIAGSGSINFTPSTGTLEGTTWTGNAVGVSFLNNATPYLASATVTLAAKDEATATLPAIAYTEAANIAAFNALEAGTYVKLTLTDAEVIGVSADGYSTVFVQDATGGTWVQYTSLNSKLQEMTKVNGTIYCVKRFTSGNSQIKETADTPASELTAETLADLTIVEGTLDEVNVAANLGRVVKITGAEFVATSATAGTLTQGESSISVNNGAATANQQLHKIADTWTKDETTMSNVTVVAILVATSATKNQLLPISMVANDVADGIANVETADGQAQVYSLQGIRQSRPVKGLYIVGGKKMVVK